MKYAKDQNVWKPSVQYTNVDGVWKRVKEAYSKVNGTWKTTIPPIGTFIEGGYVAGIIDTLASGGERYLVITAPKQYQVVKQWSIDSSTYPGLTATSKWDGLSNTIQLQDAVYPAAYYCATAVINGYDDWYLPAIDELELQYRNFKPTHLMNDYDPSDVYQNQSNGYNPSSDPPCEKYYNTVIKTRDGTIITLAPGQRYDYDMLATVIQGFPLQTNIDIFKENGLESFWPPNNQQSYFPNYFSSTTADSNITLIGGNTYYDRNEFKHIAYTVFFYSAPCGNCYSKAGRESIGANWHIYSRKYDARYVRPIRRVPI